MRVLFEAYSPDSLDGKEIGHRLPPRFLEQALALTLLKLNSTLLDHFFPASAVGAPHTILLSFRNLLALEAFEIDRALACWSPSSAPGPDKTPDSVWKRKNTVAPALMLNPLSPVLSCGFHPPSLNKRDGIVLDKPGKPSYNSPACLRVIVLPQTVMTILERNINGRLSCMAHVTGLINPHQCGSLAGWSVADACNTLTHEDMILHMDKRKVSTPFLDIKGGFDKVNQSSLCGMVSAAKGVSPYLVSWTLSFSMGRSYPLLFPGSPKAFAPISVGTPQV